MDLKIEGKIVVITKDVNGFCNQISELLKIENAIPMIIDIANLADLETKIKETSHDAKIDGFINICHSEKTICNDDILMYFQKRFKTSNCLSSNFSIINIGTNQLLDINGDSMENDLVNMNDNNLNNFFQFRLNNIVHTDIKNQISETFQMSPMAIKISVANSVAFLLSRITTNINNQTIFVNNGGAFV